MQQADIILYIMSLLWVRYKNVPGALVSEQTNVIYDSDVPGSGSCARRLCGVRRGTRRR